MKFKVKLISLEKVVAWRIMQIDGLTPDTLKLVEELQNEVLAFQKMGFEGRCKIEAVKEEDNEANKNVGKAELARIA